MKYVVLVFIMMFYHGCYNEVSTTMNLSSIYGITKDERGIYSITRDKIIKTKIQAKIMNSKNLSNFDIGVESFWGEVILLGEVENLSQRKELINIAKNTDGVRKIKTFIKFKKDRICSRSAELIILATLKKDLIADSLIDSTNIVVSVVQCNVIFSGVIDNKEQEKRVIWYAKNLDNVREIHSFLQILD